MRATVALARCPCKAASLCELRERGVNWLRGLPRAGMFREATSFNGGLSSWNVGKVTNMECTPLTHLCALACCVTL